jgi:hypothetical protein
MWAATAIAALADVVLLWAVARLVPDGKFMRLKWPVTAVAAAFWSGIWSCAMWGPWWSMAYGHVFPGWSRPVVPPAYGTLFGGAGMGMWWLAGRLRRAPSILFCALGGLVSLPGHLFAIYGRGMLETVPVLQGVSPASALVFGIFEFMIYWAVILLAAAGIDRARAGRGPRRDRPRDESGGI